MTEIHRPDPLHLTPPQRLEAERLYQRALVIEREGTPKNTRRAYEGDWRRFSEWCARWGHRALPVSPQVAILYVSYLADPERPPEGKSAGGACKASTIDRAMAAISYYHRLRGYVSPRESVHVQAHVRKTKNVLRVAPEQAPPLLVRHLEAIVACMPATEPDVLRDKAILLVGWAGALRRSEISALDRRDVAFTPEGMIVTLRASKTDQEGRGAAIPVSLARNVALCPVLALRAWLGAFPGEPEEPLFVRTYFGGLTRERLVDRQVSERVKYWADRAGIAPDQPGAEFSGHSLRAGFITEAARAGRPDWTIMGHSRHKSYESFRGYIRRANLFSDNPGRDLL